MAAWGSEAVTSAHGEAAPAAGVVGLGLIGGSFARAYRAAGWDVYAHDIDRDTFEAASVETVAGDLDDGTIAACRIIILAAYPKACLDWLEEHADAIAAAGGDGPAVIDTAGVKRSVCGPAFELARTHGFAFCGAHPMAGREFSGFAASSARLFEGAPMVLVPPEDLPDMARLELLDRVHTALEPCGFGSFTVTTPEEHDRMIAFTSQLAHVVSNAYVKSPTARSHEGFSAGSYRDLTRVARLNPHMWSELMIDDADNLAGELDTLIGNLDSARSALRDRDRCRLERVLAEGDRIKRALDDKPAARSGR